MNGKTKQEAKTKDFFTSPKKELTKQFISKK